MVHLCRWESGAILKLVLMVGVAGDLFRAATIAPGTVSLPICLSQERSWKAEPKENAGQRSVNTSRQAVKARCWGLAGDSQTFGVPEYGDSFYSCAFFWRAPSVLLFFFLAPPNLFLSRRATKISSTVGSRYARKPEWPWKIVYDLRAYETRILYIFLL